MVVVYFVVALMCSFGTCLGLDDEPRCFSRFDYEEKLLEKAVKNDIQIKEVLEKLNHALAAFEGQKADYEAASTKLENMITGLETSVDEKIHEKMKNKTVATPVVFFNARKLKNTSPSGGETLQYTIMDQNEGDAFDKETGIFTSPYRAMFLFSVQICTEKTVWGRVKLIVNGTEVLSVNYKNSADSWTTTSGTTVQQLEVGDRVWVKSTHSGDKYKDGSSYGWNQFSGVLLYKL